MNKKTLAILTASIFVPTLAYADDKPAKTAVDVADQALTMLSGAASKISDMLQKTAPEVWRIMIRQQYTEAVRDTSVSALFLLLTVVTYFSTRKYLKIDETVWKYSTEQDWKHVCKWFILGGNLVAAIVFICYLAGSIGQVMNPEYYAIKNMFELAQGK